MGGVKMVKITTCVDMEPAIMEFTTTARGFQRIQVSSKPKECQWQNLLEMCC